MITTDLLPYAIAFLIFAVIASVTALGVMGVFLVQNRHQRLARHESIPTYYRGLIASH